VREQDLANTRRRLEPAALQWADTAGILEEAEAQPLHDGVWENHANRRALKEARAGDRAIIAAVGC
jgi:hypothetical protein